VVEWWSGGVVEWWSGGVVEWWSGGVVEWWGGGVVEWWSGGVVEWWSSGAVLENTTGVFKSLIETRSKRADQAFWNARQRLDQSITPSLQHVIPS
jgi:hypothetical protein